MSVDVVHVVGARPNFMKVAPVIAALKQYDEFKQCLVHTGQHYDYRMSQVFFEDLGIPSPDVHLEIGSASHAVQTAKIMIAFEQVLIDRRPDLVVVVGDVNSTLACTLTAVKQGIPVAHIEAGLRSYNRAMPEEINRLVTDCLCDFLFVTERSGVENLINEGISKERIHFVGNVMIDTLYANLPRAQRLNTLSDFGLSPQNYALLTLHRPANVDDKAKLEILLETMGRVGERIPVLFPIHPRTRERITEFGLGDKLKGLESSVSLSKPLGYVPFLNVMSNAQFVMTDSGGIQEETTALGIPCLTLREETERPITVEEGTNVIVGTSPDSILQEVDLILSGNVLSGLKPELWDGRAAKRIASVLWDVYGNG